MNFICNPSTHHKTCWAFFSAILFKALVVSFVTNSAYSSFSKICILGDLLFDGILGSAGHYLCKSQSLIVQSSLLLRHFFKKFFLKRVIHTTGCRSFLLLNPIYFFKKFHTFVRQEKRGTVVSSSKLIDNPQHNFKFYLL